MTRRVIVTDAAEQPDDYVRVTAEDGETRLLEADDVEGIAEAVHDLSQD
jgi:hypothetical protein